MTPKLATRRGQRAAAGLARRLLSLGRQFVSNVPLYALVIYGVGCVIPTPLDPAKPGPNLRPVILVETVSPKFGPLVRTTQSLVTFSFSAEDGDQADSLYARLFVARGGALVTVVDDVPMAYPAVIDPDHPFVRTGESHQLPVCGYPGGVDSLYLAVADRPFDANADTANGGLVDENHWELQCM
jgi:hypothetical protein